ncbi:MAG TPA: sodium/proton-translocating pyrophosphatase, partial [Turneriella sp.]|nr:sodium/proton-translocating pyrophosphatase [Turneriella sp.]
MVKFRKGALFLLTLFVVSSSLWASEADLKVPDLASQSFLGIDGRTLLTIGLAVCFLGIIFGLVEFFRVKNMPVHKAMREVSELIYETCKTYMITQGKFLSLLWLFVAAIMIYYFGFLAHSTDAAGQVQTGYGFSKVAAILACSVLGILGSYGVAWFGIRINTFANSRTAFAALAGKPYNVYAIPLRSGMSIGVLLISVALVFMLAILLFMPADYAGACFIGFAIGESLGASALRIAGGIFTKIADIGSDLMKIVFKIKEDDARNPGVIADCAGDNAGDSVGPTADGFETYGVTAVALISLVLLAVFPQNQVQLLVWIFSISITMIFASLGSYYINAFIARARYKTADNFNFETPLSSLVWITSIVSVGFTYLVSYLLIANLGDGTIWYKLASIISCGTLAGAVIPEVVKAFTSTDSAHVREVV